MARIRTIKPSFYRHETLQDLERAHPGAYTMLVFSGLWTAADCAGRFEWRPRQLKLDILPFLDFDMADTLRLLAEAGFIIRYRVGGKEYGAIPSFHTHQRLSGKEAQEKSKIPAPEQHDGSDDEPLVKERGSTGEASGKQLPAQEGEGSNGVWSMESFAASDDDAAGDEPPEDAPRERNDYPPEFDLTWNAYPRRAGGNSKRDAYKAWCARRKNGVDIDDLHNGVLRYSAFLTATGKIGTEFVKTAATFFGPGMHYAEAWEIPPEPARVVGSISGAKEREAERIWLLCKRYGFHHCTRSTIDGELQRAKDAGDIEDAETFKATLRSLDVQFLRDARSDGAAITSIAKRLAA